MYFIIPSMYFRVNLEIKKANFIVSEFLVCEIWTKKKGHEKIAQK